MTFYAETLVMWDLVASLRSHLPPAYEAIPGFRGLVVLEKPGAPNHIIAVTLWEDDEGLQASEGIADAFAERIGLAAGTSVTRNIYNVIGTIGMAADEGSPG